MAKPEKILAQELLAREVMDLKAGVTIGSIADFALSPDGHVKLVGILPCDWYRGGRGITPSSIVTVNRERLCIDDSNQVTAFVDEGDSGDDLLLGEHIQGKTVLGQEGEMLGSLVDYAFSLEDGRICDLVVLGDEQKKTRVAVEAITAIGRDYIVIQRGSQGFSAEEAADRPAETQPAEGETPDPKSAAAVEAAVPVSRTPTQAASLKAEEKLKTAPEPEASEQEDQSAAPEAETVAPSRTEEKQALFGESKPTVELSKFDQKKYDYLLGKEVHRDIKSAEDELIIAKGEMFDEYALAEIVRHNLLGEVFIERTLKK